MEAMNPQENFNSPAEETLEVPDDSEPVPDALPLYREDSDLAHEAEARGEALLAQLATEKIQTDFEVRERFGSETLSKVKGIATRTLTKLESAGESALQWAENKGVPLPKSKLGNALAAGGLGAVGFLPGAGLLWGMSYVFAKRAANAGKTDRTFNDALSGKAQTA